MFLKLNTFLNAAGYEIGKSLYEKDLVETSKELIEQAKKNNCNILLPDDVLTGNKFEEKTTAEIKSICDIDRNDIASFFAAQAVGNNSLFTRGTGKVLNPNLELLFNGPSLRSFAYNFRFTPREEREAREVRRIIKFFKKNMAPQRVPSKLFLKTPNVFKLKYIFKGGRQHPFLNKIKMCALQSFNVSYAPDGSYMTYDDGSMTAYNVSMTFGELNPIYENDFDDDSNDMGF